jgi:hypothetical protein
MGIYGGYFRNKQLWLPLCDVVILTIIFLLTTTNNLKSATLFLSLWVSRSNMMIFYAMKRKIIKQFIDYLLFILTQFQVS